MPKEQTFEFEGSVVSMSRDAVHVQLDDNGSTVRGRLSGRMRMQHIRVLPGDRVRIQLSPYDPERARIVWRYTGPRTDAA